ncbi:MAG: hypothetical protein KGJ06_09850 [Pseudomonadota bacterium]|nr:hypothetical protein [Pseudomonadota bacterium]
MYAEPAQYTMKDENLPHYKSKYDAWKKIKVYFIPAFDKERGEKMYFYAIASATLHDQMMDSLRHGDIPHFAVIVEKGYGDPTPEVKAKIKDYYGFDHDYYAGLNANDNNEDATAE